MADTTDYAMAAGQTALNASFTAAGDKRQRAWSEEQNRLQNQRNDINYWRDYDVNQSNWKQQNQYNEGLWNKQNNYNELMWNKANDYNSPLAQMNRYKEAGLNPNLIYGQSNMGGSIATANLESASPTPSRSAPSNAPQHKPNIPQFDFIGGLASITSMRESAARTNNLEALNAVYAQDAILRAAQTGQTLASTAETKRGTAYNERIADISYNALEAGLQKNLTETDLMNKRFGMDQTSQKTQLELMRSQIKNEKKKNELMELERSLKAKGLEGSPWYIRILARWYERNVGSLDMDNLGNVDLTKP